MPQEADGIDLAALDATCGRLHLEGRRVKFLYVVPNFQNPTGLLIGLAKRQRLLEWAARRDVLIVEDDPYRDSISRTRRARPTAANQGRRSRRPRHLPEQLLEDARAGVPRRLDRRAARADGEVRDGQTGGRSLTGSLDQRLVYEACRRGVLERQLPLLRAHYAHKRDVMEQALRRELGADRELAETARRLLPLADARERPRRRQDDPARDGARRDLRGG